MHRFRTPALALLATATLFAQPAAAQESATLKKIKDSGTIALGHRESSIPFSYYDDKQQVVGYSQELLLKVVDAVKAELAAEPGRQADTGHLPEPHPAGAERHRRHRVRLHHPQRRAGRQAAFSNTIFIIGTRLMTKKDSGIKDFPTWPARTSSPPPAPPPSASSAR
jgi:glutamate/aspartate transport system substrate-binding protein